MDLEHFLTGARVEPPQMLAARERRAALQQAALEKYPMSLISFTLNIAGPVKVFPLAVRTYEEGLGQIRCQCRVMGVPVVHTRELRETTGYEALLSVDAPARALKEALARLEQNSSLGRLFDIDVLDANGRKLSRTELGLPERACLVCGKPAFQCSSTRAHSLDEILPHTCSIMWDYFAERYGVQLASAASRALLYEVLATPKPGLVDKANSGSHRDMDIVTFETSALALIPYFKAFVTYGVDHCDRDPGTFLADLRPIGIQAEFDMLRATGGVNTHKGIIFSLGLILAALGAFYGQERTPTRQELRELCQAIAAPLAADFDRLDGGGACSHGERTYAAHGIRGARGEALDGFPTLFNAALPTMDALLDQGVSLNDAGVVTLLHIIAAAQDTNLIARSSYERMEAVRAEVQALLDRDLPLPQLLAETAELDRRFIAENLSPGGSADLLALTYFIRFLEQEGLLCSSPVRFQSAADLR